MAPERYNRVIQANNRINEPEKVKDNIKGTIKHRLYYAYRNCWLELPEWFK
jgi:hypothetical protein